VFAGFLPYRSLPGPLSGKKMTMILNQEIAFLKCVPTNVDRSGQKVPD